MSDKDNNSDKEKTKSKSSDKTVSIGPHLLASGDFDKLYGKGMSLIEEVAAYLDGEGRKESRELDRDAAFVYASESMRLTTRLMQMASWLLLQRAIVEGEISSQAAKEEKAKIKFTAPSPNKNGPGWDKLPKKLAQYIEMGDELYERVIQLDRLEKGGLAQKQEQSEINKKQKSGIEEQLSRLNEAFGKKPNK